MPLSGATPTLISDTRVLCDTATISVARADAGATGAGIRATTEGDQQAGYQCEARPAHGFHSIAFRNRLLCRFALMIVLFDLACAHTWVFAYADERDTADE